MSEEKIAAIPSWQTWDGWTPVERAVLAYTDALVYDGGRVADGVFDSLREHLGDEEILELTYITALYEMHAVMSRALRTEFDDRPEPIFEVAAPEGYTGSRYALWVLGQMAGPSFAHFSNTMQAADMLGEGDLVGAGNKMLPAAFRRLPSLLASGNP